MATYLLDTHAFIWQATGSSQLSKKALSVIQSDHEILLSIASIWEMAIKVNIGKLSFSANFPEIIKEEIEANSYQISQIQPEHLFALSRLPHHHKDPFDRILIAQAITERIPIVSIDSKFDLYSVQRIW